MVTLPAWVQLNPTDEPCAHFTSIVSNGIEASLTFSSLENDGSCHGFRYQYFEFPIPLCFVFLASSSYISDLLHLLSNTPVFVSVYTLYTSD